VLSEINDDDDDEDHVQVGRCVTVFSGGRVVALGTARMGWAGKHCTGKLNKYCHRTGIIIPAALERVKAEIGVAQLGWQSTFFRDLHLAWLYAVC